jgi:uncharacterized protein
MRKILRALMVASLLSTTGGIVRAGPFEDAGAAYQRGDYETALRLLRPLAERGDRYAQFSLGLMYAKGEGVIQDYREAMKWHLLSAQQGYALAQTSIGLMYGLGIGVPQDDLRADMWLSLAASRLSGDDRKQTSELRDTVEKTLTPAEIMQAQEMARQCEASGFKNCD